LEDSQLLVIDNNNKQWHINKANDDMVHTQKQMDHSLDNLSHFDMPELSAEYALQITAFAEMIKLACIVDDMHNFYAPSPSKAQNWHHQQVIVARLTHWLVHLPSYLEYGKPKVDSAPSPIARMYHMLYYTVQIMLYQPYLQQHQQHMDPMTTKSTSAPDIVMARSICTNAANTIVHISEQMIQHNQHMYLHNTFMISLTLASSVHLENAMNSDQTPHNISSLLNLGKSFDVLKNGNGSMLSPMELDQLLHRFLLDHCGIRLDGKWRPPYRSCCQKRNLDTFMDNDDHDVARKRRPPTKPLCTANRIFPAAVKDLEININSNKDDLLDTRLYHLLQGAQPYIPSIPSPSASNVVDTSWLDETNSILDLFPEVSPTSLPSPQGYFSDSNSSTSSSLSPSSSSSSKQACYGAASVGSLYSPISFISPTQSPTLSPDSHQYTVMTPISSTSNYTMNDYGTEYLKSSGYHLLAPPLSMDMYVLMSDSTSIPHLTH
jgi:hypothetical protein